MKKTIAIVLSLLFVTAFSGAARAQGTGPVPLKEGDIVPKMSISMLSGKSLDFEAETMKGKTILLTFIQTTCSSCKWEIIELNKLVKAGAKAMIIPIAVDTRTGKEFLDQYKAENGVGFDFGVDPKFTVPPLFGLTFTPATVVIKDGKVSKIYRGYDPAIKDEIEKLVM